MLAYYVNNTYAKLASDSIINKKIKEIMRYTGRHRTFPLDKIRYDHLKTLHEIFRFTN